MSFPDPSPAQASAFRERGWLALDEAVPAGAVDELRARTRPVIDEPARVAFDSASVTPGEPSLHSALSLVWPEWEAAPFHAWARRFAAGLLGRDVDFWYDQVLFKPPREGAATPWHQDDGYFDAPGGDFLVSCWLALDDVDAEAGCMHYLDGGHRQGIVPGLGLRRPGEPGHEVDPARVVAVPLRAGGAVFHHGKTPHMAPPNRSQGWRRVVIQRFTVRGVPRPTTASH